VKARLALEQPGLGMQSRRTSVVADLELGSQSREFVDCSLLAGSHIGGGEHLHGYAAGPCLLQDTTDEAHATPLDEAHDNADALVRRGDLAGQGSHQARLTTTVHEEVGHRQADLRTREPHRLRPHPGW
jgi:hypothetical protein